MTEQQIGFVDHWYGHMNVAGVKVTEGSLKEGDTLHFKGHTTDFTETVNSIELEHEHKTHAEPGDAVGVKVSQKCRLHDKVYKVTD
jgi:putative protease